jgi:hypothetical protein
MHVSTLRTNTADHERRTINQSSIMVAADTISFHLTIKKGFQLEVRPKLRPWSDNPASTPLGTPPPRSPACISRPVEGCGRGDRGRESISRPGRAGGTPMTLAARTSIGLPELVAARAGAIIPQRRRPVRMLDHARQFLDKSRKAIGPIRHPLKIHPSYSA